MHIEMPLLNDIVIILGLAVVIILIFQRLKLPGILGFLITGMIVGPYGLNLIKAIHEVELLAEIGVVFLLFVIGIEFSLKGLASIKRTVLLGGTLQVGGTIALVTLISTLIGLPLDSAIFMGFLICLSSTAIVLKMLQEQGDLTTPYGRVSVAILIFQDIVVVLMILLTPMLAGQLENPGIELLILLGKVIAIVAVVILLARYIVPNLLKQVVKTKSQELFILTIVVLCFAVASLTAFVGLSLALGAFFAGLIISESDYSHQANANILPFREIFISFFFVSVGMLLDLNFFIENILWIHLAAFGVTVLKMLVIGLTAFILKYQSRTIILTSLTIFQVGEFAFVLSTAGMEYQLLSENLYQYFLAISIISMGATPFVIKYSQTILNTVSKFSWPTAIQHQLLKFGLRSKNDETIEVETMNDHLIIIGYGINGKNVAKAARKAQIPFVIIELDHFKLEEAKKNGDNIVYGDATNEEILKHVRVQKARTIVVAVSDHNATTQIVSTIRLFTQTAYVIVRTRYIREVEAIKNLGADEVIPEEFETSIEIFTRVMKQYLVPNNEIASFVNDIRSHNYGMLRNVDPTVKKKAQSPIHVSEMEIATIPVHQGNNEIVGKTIAESGMRSNFNVTVVAIKRGEEYITDLNREDIIYQDDILYIFGKADDILKVDNFCVIR